MNRGKAKGKEKGWVSSRPRSCNQGHNAFKCVISVFLKDVKESNLISWSGNQIEKQGDNESRNEFDLSDRVGNSCQILELELVFVA